ncbi:hypothetical protein [Fontimonas sp. SYSU GA230001]|uniref:hypothetical protein n=1 Tax=Fontimonas sp. SYSU GA230001 TaxID=3142450 RepID=UPI0032B40BBE
MKKMRNALWLLTVLSASAAAEPAKMSKSVPFESPTTATEAVQKECGLPEQLATWVADAAGDRVTLVDGEAQGGKVLKMKITHVLGVGGPFTPKSLSVGGELLDNGKVVGSFHARRQTSGGPTCAALAKCAKSLGKDIAGFLAAPSMDAKLGDAK